MLILALVVVDLDAILNHASAVTTAEFSAELPSEAELKQIAHSQLSLERVDGKILDDRNAELG
jgi:hypothetical protein